MILWQLCRAVARLLEQVGLRATYEERELDRIDRDERLRGAR